ncbi:MAG: hypothetical protein HYV26_23870 [Candidatus Hydrogenedentes bacterium]|nr:hypothetical protein [Candidatus Hydrogenedentota bacterium]
MKADEPAGIGAPAGNVRAASSPAASVPRAEPGPNGLRGKVHERLPDGSIGPTIPWVKLTFEGADGRSFLGQTDALGQYTMVLPPMQYRVTVQHDEFETLVTDGGSAYKVRGEGTQTAMFYLKRKKSTA